MLTNCLKAANDQLSRTSSIELIKKLLNNNQLDEAEDAELVPASSPTFRRPPSVIAISRVQFELIEFHVACHQERLVYHEENCLPNVVQDPDDRPAFVGSGQSRFVDYSMQFDDEDEAFGKGRNLTTSQERVLAEEEYEIDDGVNFVSELRAPHHYPTANSTTSSPSKSAVRLGPKSRSLASFAGRNSPDDSARRQRSLPVRRLDSSRQFLLCNAKRSLSITSWIA